MEVPSLPGYAWIETKPPIKKERLYVLQVDTDEEYAKILQRNYNNEGGVLFAEQQVQSVACNENIKILQPLEFENFSTIPKLISFVSTKF